MWEITVLHGILKFCKVLKNKKSIHFLLPVTLAIWGFIGYKVYQYMSAGDEDVLLTENITPINTEKIIADSFALFNNYRDPFLGNDGKEMDGIPKNNYSLYATTNKPKIAVVPTNTVVAKADWPKIIYTGMMLNASNQQSIGFLSVDGVSQRVKPGDKILSELKIISFTQNEITIQRGKEKRVFGK